MKKIPTWLATVVVLVLVTYISLDQNPFHAHRYVFTIKADKVVHFIMYFVLTSVVIFDIAKKIYPAEIDDILLIVIPLMTTTYGILMECIQGLMDLGRDFSLEDIIANLVGCAISYLFMKFYFLKRIDDIMRS